MRRFTQEMVDLALGRAQENGYCIASLPAREVAIDLVTYDQVFEQLAYGRYAAGLDDGTEVNAAIEEVTALVKDWQDRKRNGTRRMP